MEQFKNKCCNHLGGSTTNPPMTNFKPLGLLEPGKDPGNITQSCFTLNKLPNIETVKELAFELCNVQQAFDKCPLYYTKSNFDALIDTITKAFFHLYVKLSEVTETPWFEGYAYNGTDPIEVAEKAGRDFPGVYVAIEFGEFKHFLDVQGNPIVIDEDTFNENIIFFKPVIVPGTNAFTGYELVTVNKGSSIGGVSTLQQSITYTELVDLVNQEKLNPGQLYRITDYEFTTTQEGTKSAGHNFDIIVTALDVDVLDENAKAIWHNWTGQEYFDNNPLYLWDLKYSIYNDTSLYTWADDVNGKGVIYWLKDEFGNEAGYDFKNALFGKLLYVNIPYYEDGVYVDESGKNYYTFDYVLDRSNADLSLTGAFVNCKIKFSKKLPYNKFCNKGTNVIVEGSLNYIDNGIDFVINGTLNYIDTSRNITLNSDYTIVANSLNISTSGSSLLNIIIQCHDVRLGFENNANYLRNCLYFTTDSRVSSLNINKWYKCRICVDSYNIISKDITLEHSTIGYNNQNVTFIGTGTFQNKTINPSTFTTSWQDPNYEFEFNSNIADEYETISKKQFVTYID